MRVFGVDFTSRPTRRKPITCAVCQLDGDRLIFDHIAGIAGLPAFDAFLTTPGPWVAGFDFPFAQSRQFIENIGWPQDWAGYVTHAGGMERMAFRAALEAYKAPRPYGDREHSRKFEHKTGAASPQKLYGVPVALMFYEGAPRLLRAGLDLPGLAKGDPSRTGFEAYPGVAARALLGSRAPYKTESRKPGKEARLEARQAILAALTGAAGRDRFGFTVTAPGWLADDPAGDHLDALLAAAQAAWGWRMLQGRPDALARTDPLEGWITDPDVMPG